MLILSSLLLSPPATWALRPIEHYHDLIAGEPEPGYRDGSFESALFNGPQGLALNGDGTRLYVADKNNNCIRVIFRDQNNRVETLAGSSKPGDSNGSLKEASFNKPTLLTYIGNDQLIVYDSGNFKFRSIDLAKGQVTDLAGNGKQGDVDGKPAECSLNDIWNMVYLATDNAIFFSEPNNYRLRKLDLVDDSVSSVLLNDTKILRPGALCLYQGSLCIVDSASSNVFKADIVKKVFDPIGNFDAGDKTLSTVTAIAASGKDLYGARLGVAQPWVRLPGNIPVRFFDIWGHELSPKLAPAAFVNRQVLGLLPDPNHEKKFIFTGKSLSCVSSFKDYNFAPGEDIGTYNASGMSEFDYPDKKPPKTFRILIVGNSLSYSMTFADQRAGTWNRSRSFPKELELFLNTKAALEDNPLNYEILSIGHPEANVSCFIWPYYEVPDLVKKFDIDFVLFIMPTQTSYSCNFYFQNPITAEGIPSAKSDPEYLLKPWKDKIPEGIPKDFYEKCLTHNWVKPASKTQLDFQPTQVTLTDPAVKEDVLELLSKPIKMLADKLKVLKNSEGKPVDYHMFLIFRDEVNPATELQRSFWKDMAKRDDFPLYDMVGDFLAFKPTYEGMYSYEDWHYNANGTPLYVQLVAHELLRQHLIPFPTPKPEPSK